MPHPVQRSACDRCHDQKLRCTRAPSGGACVRCTKAKATCTWTPLSIRRPKEPKRSGNNDSDALLDAAVIDTLMLTPCNSTGAEHTNETMAKTATIDVAPANMVFGLGQDICRSMATVWPDSIFLGSVANTVSSPSFTIPTGSLESASQSPPSPQAAQTPNDNILNSWQYRFNQEWAMLSADQDQAHGSATPRMDSSLSDSCKPSGPPSVPLDTIRRLTELHMELFTLASKVPKPPTCLSQPLSWKDKDVAIDRTFHLSHAFIEAVDKLDTRHVQNCPGPAVDGTNSPAVADGPALDQASLLLVLSCYQRLIETYDDIFGNMQACLDRSSITAREDYVQMPDVKVGSFSLPDSSALQITLILQLARHLLRRIGSMVVDLNQKRKTTNTPVHDISSITVQTVCSRENELIERINTLRNTLVSLDIL